MLCMMWCICLSIWAGKHYTVIVSLDGFRWDYPQMYDTPFFDRMAREGVKATMIPSFPSKTFPNHYTIATGLVPDHHGIVANTFWDPQRQELYKMSNLKTRNDASYYGGEPIWITAQKQGIKTGKRTAPHLLSRVRPETSAHPDGARGRGTENAEAAGRGTSPAGYDLFRGF